ncbi:MAG: hypothetical protein IJ752_04955 [Alphaproteobacteria bacterium]|nr:hypothetical protein [Alphaproteobacteria bacterium]
MGNAAAVYLLSRSGAFKGLFLDEPLIVKAVYGAQDAIDRIKEKHKENEQKRTDKEWNATPDRFAKAPFRSELIENYLKDGAQLVWNVDQSGMNSVKVTSKRGKEVSFNENYLNTQDVAQYKNFVEKRLEMIEPPSFLERVMIANKTLTESKAGRIASAASLGIVPAATAVAALSARAYGATRHFIMDKLHLHDETKDKNKKSFKERLVDINNRKGYKKDLAKLSYIEEVMLNADNQKETRRSLMAAEEEYKKLDVLQPQLRGGRQRSIEAVEGKEAEKQKFKELTSLNKDPLLANYLGAYWGIRDDGTGYTPYGLKVAYYTDKGERLRTSQDDALKIAEDVNKTPLDSKKVGEYIDKHTQALEMIEPPTKTELTLIRQLHQLNENGNRYFSARQPLIEAVNKTVELYIAEKQKENKDFSKADMMARLKDLDKRKMVENRLEKMTALQSQFKKAGR